MRISSVDFDRVKRAARSTARRGVRKARVVLDGLRQRRRATSDARTDDVISPADSLRDNGFCVFRRALPASALLEIERDLALDLGSEDFDSHLVACDAANKVPTVGRLMFDDRIQGRVREALGAEVRFLQVSGMQANNDFVSWHRDSACRTVGGPDWDESEARYAIAKAILYVRGSNTTLAVYRRSHVEEIEMNRLQELDRAGRATVVRSDENANRTFSAREADRPIVICLDAGDLILFDQRLYHRGGRFDATNDEVVIEKRACQQGPAKLTLSWVFGAPNRHSERYYSYFRYARTDLTYAPIDPALSARLRSDGLYLPEDNYFRTHAEELDHVWLRQPAALPRLKEEFAAS